jgi:5-methylcytosine-specific restriction endonuclease McrA
MTKCGLCGRELGTVLVEDHHLIPKTFKGKETVAIHKICHRKIHATFTERELQHHYHTLERILEHEEIQKFVKWVAKRSIDYYSGSNETTVRKGKR